MAIPFANTVALVGDPGTGKTTFLLLFFRQGRVVTIDQKSWLELGRDRQAEEEGNNAALATFDNLMPLPEDQNTDAEAPPKVIRVFLSMDNTFESVCRTHKRLLPNAGDADKEHWYFIDATSMLTGRLQDTLRYPRLAALHPATQEDWHVEELNLGGWNPNEPAEGPSWYWIKGDGAPLPLAECSSEDNPFIGGVEASSDNSKSGPQPRRRVVLRLMTPYLRDPLRRVGMVKDLLAALFSQFIGSGKGEDRPAHILAVDSLSTLLQEPSHDGDRPQSQGRDRRQILNLVRWLEELGVTCLMAVEAHREGNATLRSQPLYMSGLERYLASGVIQLDYHLYPSGDVIRYLQILKMRGIRHDMRPYAYDLDENGLAWMEPLIADRG